MNSKELIIEGMTCGHCINAVRKSLDKIEGLKVISVEIGKAVVEYDENSSIESMICTAIENAGYKIIP